MSNVKLQVQPRRVRCADAKQPPPFRFAAAQRERSSSAAPLALRIPLRVVAFLFAAVAHLIDAAFFLVGLTVWCSLHIVLWSYAFQMGPAADCFGLPCPGWLTSKVIMGLAALGVISFVVSRILRRLGHKATSMMLILLVTFDVAGLLLLGINKLT